MKFAFQTVTSLEDATGNFEQITAHGIDDATALGGALAGTMPNPSLSTASLNTFLQLLAAGSHKAAFGNGTITGTGAANPTFTIAHGLGATPGFALVGAGATSAATAYALAWIAQYQAPDSTNLYGQYAATLANGSKYGYYWIAIS